MTKRLLLILFIIVSARVCQSQFYKSIVPSPEFTNALEKIVLDFRLNFETIQGDRLLQSGETETYESAIKLPGASECFIYRYHSVKDTSASWQAIMYRGEDYKTAAKTYENVFRLVRKSHIRWIDKSSAGFSGDLETPKEDVRFAVSTLQFDLDDRRYKKFQAEVELVSVYNGWEVHLNLQTKKPDQEG